MQIFVSGSLAYDRIMDFPGKFSDHIMPDKLHILNVCFMVNGLRERFGGTAGNIAYNLVLLGKLPLILATAGKDFDRYEKWLNKQGLSLDGIKRIDEELTAGAYITTDMADNQITGFNPGAMKYPSEFQFDGIDPHRTIAIIAPGSLEDMLVYSRTYRKLNVPYIFDPGQSIPAFTGDELIEMITGSDILISNDYELEMIMGTSALNKDGLLERTKAIITTLGENGSRLTTQDQETDIPAATPVRVSDPTGAGDAYRAGVIKGLVMGKDLIEASKIGTTCASYAVECCGTQEHRFTEAEFWKRYEDNFI